MVHLEHEESVENRERLDRAANLGAMDDLDHEEIEENLDRKDHRENEVYPV